MNCKNNLRRAVLFRIFSLGMVFVLLASLSACVHQPPDNTNDTGGTGGTNNVIDPLGPYVPRSGVINLWEIRYSYGDDIFFFTDNWMYEMYDRWLPYSVPLPETYVETETLAWEDVKPLITSDFDYRDLIATFGRPRFSPDQHLGTYDLKDSKQHLNVQFFPRSDGEGNLVDVEIVSLSLSEPHLDPALSKYEVIFERKIPNEFIGLGYGADYPFPVIDEPIPIRRYYDLHLPYEIKASEVPVKTSRDQWMSLTQGLTYKELRETYGKPTSFSVCVQYPMVNYRTTEGNMVSVYLQEVTENGKLTDILVKAIKIAFTDEEGKIVEIQTVFDTTQ